MFAHHIKANYFPGKSTVVVCFRVHFFVDQVVAIVRDIEIEAEVED